MEILKKLLSHILYFSLNIRNGIYFAIKLLVNLRGDIMRKNTIAFASIFMILAALTNSTLANHLTFLINELIKMW